MWECMSYGGINFVIVHGLEHQSSDHILYFDSLTLLNRDSLVVRLTWANQFLNDIMLVWDIS